MALFRSNSDPLAVAVTARDKLRTLLNEALTAHQSATTAANAVAADGGDHATMATAENRVRASVDIVSRRKDAISQADVKIVQLEAERDIAADKKQRAATWAEVVTMASDYEDIAREFDVVVDKLAGLSARSKTFLWESVGLNTFATTSKVQVAEAIVIVSQMLREHAGAVLRGDAPASINPAEVIVPPVEPERPKLTLVFMLRPIVFPDPTTGAMQRVAKWIDVELPPVIAVRALKRKLATTMDDPKRGQLSKAFGGGYPELSWCVDLTSDASADAGMSQPDQQPNQSEPTIFTKIDRGGPIKMQIAR
jgi:hypothetical protein